MNWGDLADVWPFPGPLWTDGLFSFTALVIYPATALSSFPHTATGPSAVPTALAGEYSLGCSRDSCYCSIIIIGIAGSLPPAEREACKDHKICVLIHVYCFRWCVEGTGLRFEGVKEKKKAESKLTLHLSSISLQTAPVHLRDLPSSQKLCKPDRFHLLRAGQAVGGGRRVHVQAEHSTAHHCWPPPTPASYVGSHPGKGPSPGPHGCTGSPRGNRVLGLPEVTMGWWRTCPTTLSAHPLLPHPAAPLWIRGTIRKRLISIDCCSGPRLVFWLTFPWHQPEHLEELQLWQWLHWASSVERHQGISSRQFIPQGRWNHLPMASSPRRQPGAGTFAGGEPHPAPPHTATYLPLLPSETSTHYHTFRGENKHPSLCQLLISSSSYSWEDHESTYEGAVRCDTCASSVISDTTTQRAVKPQLWALLSVPVSAPQPEHHPARPREMILSAPVMLSPTLHDQVIRTEIQSVHHSCVGKRQQSHNQKRCLTSPSPDSGFNQICAMHLLGFIPVLSKISPLTHSKDI